MSFSRRNFIGTSLQVAGAATLLNGSIADAFDARSFGAAAGAFRGSLAIMQGLATISTSQFVVLTEAAKKYGYAVVDDAGKLYPLQLTRRETRTFSKWGIEKLLVTGLKINTRYSLRIIDPNSGNTIDERYFQSLNTNLKKPKIMIASCMKDNKSTEREQMWDDVAATKPDIVFLIGDTCYADNNSNGSDEDYWRRYCETRSLLSHFRQKTLIPTLATWDDHDFAGNNADGTFAKKDMTKDLFKLFWDNIPQENAIVKGPGVAQIFTAFGQRFFLMDSRYYRSARNAPNPVQWGALQEDFMFENLHANKTPSWLMNGSQFFGGYLQKDAFEYWQLENFKNVCKKLSQVEAPVVFASGDVHFTEYMQIEPQVLGYKTFEITSSSIHSTTISFLHLRKKNPRRIWANSSHQFTNVTTEINPDTTWSISAETFKMGLSKTIGADMVVKR